MPQTNNFSRQFLGLLGPHKYLGQRQEIYEYREETLSNFGYLINGEKWKELIDE
jgi:hypothetical protein